MIHRFDNNGTILSSVTVGLPISGLAYNPDSRHLFVMTSGSTTRVYVLDVANDYAVLGQFSISQGFGAYGGAGLEFDCDGNLWAMDLNTNTVYQFSSGEVASICHRDVPWISTQPVSGTLGTAADQPVQVRFDAGVQEVDQPGAYSMQLKIKENSPYNLPNLPVTMTVSAPATWGKLEGVVRGLGYCNADPGSLANANVFIIDKDSQIQVFQTDTAGHYQRWLDEARSPFEISVNHAGYLPAGDSGVVVSAGITTTINFDLPWQQPCVQVHPQSINLVVKSGKQVTTMLTIENPGYADANIFWVEGAGNISDNKDWLSVAPVTGTLPLHGISQALVTLDTAGTSASLPGIYTTTLNLNSNDPVRSTITVPVTLTVVERLYGVTVSGDMSGEDIPGEVVTYTMSLTNASEGLVDSFNISLGGHAWQTTAIPPMVGSLASGGTAQVKLRVQIPASALPGEHQPVLVSAVSQGDPTRSASLTVTTTAQIPSADLSIVKVAAPEPAWVGQPLTYTITLTNSGPTKAPQAALVEVLPSRVDYLSSDTACTLTGHVLVCDLGTLAVGELRTVHILVRPLGSGVLVNQAVITSEAGDPNLDNNWSTVQTLALGYVWYLPLIGR